MADETTNAEGQQHAEEGVNVNVEGDLNVESPDEDAEDKD